MPDTVEPTEKEYRRFQLVQAERHQEQAHFWSRFTAFATLHAGIFIFATATNVLDRPIATILIAIVGIILAAIWAEVLRLSLHYVNRWKPEYHATRAKLNFHFPDENTTDPRYSSTDLALIVPYAVLAIWAAQIVIMVLPAVKS